VLELLGDETGNHNVYDEDLAEEVLSESRELDRKTHQPIARDSSEKDLIPVIIDA
jgi:hypothetical protein